MCFFFYLLGTQTPKSMRGTFNGKRKQDYQKRLFWIFISYWQTKTLFLKRIQNALYWETEQHYQKTCALSVFQLVIIKIFKIYVKHPISGNETTFLETCCFVTFKHSRHLTLEKKKKTWRILYIGKQNNFIKKLFLCVLSLLLTETLKCVETALY